LCDVYLKTVPENNNNNNNNNLLGQTSKAITTPDRVEGRKSLPKTPKSPFNASPKVKLLVAEMLYQLLTDSKERHMVKSLKLGKFLHNHHFCY